MSDKSPRQTMTKKSGKSLKEKRAAKQAKTASRASSTEALLHDKRRLPIHPEHFARIDHRVRRRIFLEHGYGAEFGATDAALAELVGGIRSREQLIADCDIVLLPKVQAEDLTELNVGQVVWGWPHCVQDPPSRRSPLIGG